LAINKETGNFYNKILFLMGFYTDSVTTIGVPSSFTSRIISGISWHAGKTTDLPKSGWIALTNNSMSMTRSNFFFNWEHYNTHVKIVHNKIQIPHNMPLTIIL
jgi:hypothetical protein